MEQMKDNKSYRYLVLADNLLHKETDKHSDWAHALLHQAIAHLSPDKDIRDLVEKEALKNNNYNFSIRNNV